MQTGFTRTQVMDMEKGTWEPDWIPTMKLLDLHYDLCGKSHSFVAVSESSMED